MKILKKLAPLVAAVMMITALSSCEGGKWALKIGGRTISAERYRATAISIKSQFLTENDLEENDGLWEKYIDETYSSTVQEYLDAMVQTYIITYDLYSIHFDELGLKLDDAKVEEIKNTMKSLENQYGGRDNLDKLLKEQGFSYESFEEQYYSEAKKKAVIMYYFGPDSTEQPVSREALREYYEEYYTKIRQVFLSTKDSESNDFSRDEKEKVGQRAQEIYDKAAAGEDFDALVNEYNEDPGMASNAGGYVFSRSDTTYNRMFYNAAFEMKPGEIRLLQTNLGYHIMKKYPFTDEEIFAPEAEASLIENMMSEESAAILDGLKERIGVEYNNEVLKELSVVNLPSAAKVTDPNRQMTDQIKEHLGLDDTEE